MKKIDWNRASELGLVERINKEVLHPLGLAMARDTASGYSPCLLVAPDGEFSYPTGYAFKPVLTKEQVISEASKGRGGISEKQFDFLVRFINNSTSGSKNSETIISAAKKYTFDFGAWSELKDETCGRVFVTKKLSKDLSDKVQAWDRLFKNWPEKVEDKFNLIHSLGGKPISANVVNAVFNHVEDGLNINKAAIANDCFYHSVKSALAKIEKFDKAAKEYGEL